MNESELVKLQFWGLALFFGLILPVVVGCVMWGWSVLRQKWALWRAGRGRDG